MASNWVPLATVTELGEFDVHVWRVPVDAESALASANGDELNQRERETAERFAHRIDRDRYWASHIGLRRILGGYVGVDPAELQFEFGNANKPFLAGKGPMPRFSLSHSGGWAIIAVAQTPLGADVECPRDLANLDLMVARWCTPRERRLIQTLSEADQLQAFFKCWTGKEAILKGVGCGLHADANLLDVLTDDDQRQAVVPPSIDAARWQVRWFHVDANHRGAIATQTKATQTEFFHWRDES